MNLELPFVINVQYIRDLFDGHAPMHYPVVRPGVVLGGLVVPPLTTLIHTSAKLPPLTLRMRRTDDLHRFQLVAERAEFG